MYRLWLFCCCLMVIIMVGIGGVTRLTGSGLSITEWRPITGILPPFSAKMWIKEKAKYEQTPEFLQKNYNISLKEFKRIYLIEYFHRLWGRLIGIIFIGPYIYFLSTRRIDVKTNVYLISAIIIGFVQAYVGWYMVKGGLNKLPYISPFRLTLHLYLAVAIYILLFEAFLLSYPSKVRHSFKIEWWILLGLVLLQVGYGGLMAGLKAGLIFNSFPLMGSSLLPPTLFFYKPWWVNLFIEPSTVQFIHRWIGTIILVLSVFFFYKYKVNYPYSRLINFLPIIVSTQFILGVLTLIWKLPLGIALFHQLFAFILLSYILYLKKVT